MYLAILILFFDGKTSGSGQPEVGNIAQAEEDRGRVSRAVQLFTRAIVQRDLKGRWTGVVTATNILLTSTITQRRMLLSSTTCFKLSSSRVKNRTG
jgi:hypothetical protein